MATSPSPTIDSIASPVPAVGAVYVTGAVEAAIAELPPASAPLSAGTLGATVSAQVGISVSAPAQASVDAAGGAAVGLAAASAPLDGDLGVDTIIPVTSLLATEWMLGLSFLAGPELAGAVEVGPELSPAHAGVGAVALGAQTSALTGLGPATLTPQARPLGVADGVGVGLPTAAAPVTARPLGSPTASIDPAQAPPLAGDLGIATGAKVGIGVADPLEAQGLGVSPNVPPIATRIIVAEAQRWGLVAKRHLYGVGAESKRWGLRARRK